MQFIFIKVDNDTGADIPLAPSVSIWVAWKIEVITMLQKLERALDYSDIFGLKLRKRKILKKLKIYWLWLDQLTNFVTSVASDFITK